MVLGPLKSVQELRREQQLAEIESRRQEREKNGQEEGGEGRTKPLVQEMVDELQGPFSYDFSYWARWAPWVFLRSVLCSHCLPSQGAEAAKLKYFNYFRSGEKITVTPSSKELLFYPPSMEAMVSGGKCQFSEPAIPLCHSSFTGI